MLKSLASGWRATSQPAGTSWRRNGREEAEAPWGMTLASSFSHTPRVEQLTTKLFADGADLGAIRSLAQNPAIQGFTTNPTLMRKAGVTDYRAFATATLEVIAGRPISFEVFADDFDEMERQARIIAAWGENIFVKIPVTDTRGSSTVELVRRLSADGIRLNVTALMTPEQVAEVADGLRGGAPAFISVFAGRIADTGRDPLPIMEESLRIMSGQPQLELIWASPRELLNVFQADAIGCHVITATSDILGKLGTVGKDLDVYSLETVKMFHRDATEAAFEL